MTLARGLIDLLLRALWEDAGIALVGGVILTTAGRRLNAATRYTAFQGMLLAMVIVPLLSTVTSGVPTNAATTVREVVLLPGSTTTADVATTPATRTIRIASSDACVLSLCVVWLTGVVFFGSRLILGAVHLSRLVRASETLGERDGVRVLVSPDLAIPIAFGLLRPTVAVPSSLAASGGEELGFILLHELAHLHRRDPWANVWERLTHAVLFYNPPVVLVLRAIALEREAACDDWAVARSCDVDAYVRSLASFALRRAGVGRIVAPGTAGFEGSTLARVRRLEDVRRNPAVPVNRAMLGGFAVMLVLLSLGMQTFGPSIAFAESDRAAPLASAAACTHRVQGPRYPSLPPGLRAVVDASVSAQGLVARPTIVTSSGDARFDDVTVRSARELLTAVGQTVPPACSGLPAGTYRLVLESGVTLHNGSRALRWTVSNERMRKPVVLVVANPPTGVR